MKNEDNVLGKVIQDFELLYSKNKKVKEFLDSLINNNSNYKTLNGYAIEVGEILSKSLIKNINFLDKEIIDETLNGSLKNNYDMIIDYATKTQQKLNDLEKIGLKPAIPKINKDRINGFITKVDDYSEFKDYEWVMKEPIVNYSQSVVDDFVQENVEQHNNAGLTPKIIRSSTGNCCKWCENLIGVYDYDSIKNTGSVVFRRHRRCRCRIEFVPVKGKRQDVRSKKWYIEEQKNIIEERKDVGNKYSFTPAKNIKEANAFAESMGYKADYSGVDVAVANDWNEGLFNAKKQFPEVAEQFQFVGSTQARNKLMKQDIYEYYLNKYRLDFPHWNERNIVKFAKKDTSSFMSRFRANSGDMAQNMRLRNIPNEGSRDYIVYRYSGVSMNSTYFKKNAEVLQKGVEQVKNKWHPVGCHTTKATFDHEFAHELDKYLKVSESETIRDLFDSRTRDEITNGLSEYSWNNNNPERYSEMIAEGWSEFCNNPQPREMARVIGEEILRLWKEKK